MLNVNSKLVCTTCYECMFDAIHDLYVSGYLNDVNARVKSKSVKSIFSKSKKKEMWKPTGKVYTKVGYIGKPTGRTFTIVGNICPLTRLLLIDPLLCHTCDDLYYSRSSLSQPRPDTVVKFLMPLLYRSRRHRFMPATPSPATGLESVSIRRIQGVGYGVLEFLGVGTTFDIFQNILFPYSLNTAYFLSWIRRIGLVSFVVFGECRHIYAVSSLMDTAYWLSEH
ncbi:hypothetical protein Tco_0289863 [Tanacetum coccineum]